jgi:hypothetical protein
MSAPPPTDPFANLLPASRLTRRTLEWLWQGRLPFGHLALLDGDPGLGKSLLALDLCARLSTGRPFPDGTPGIGPAPSLILNGEDGAGDTILSRLRAAGADLDLVHVLDVTADRTVEPPHFPTHAGPLAQAVARTGARLVVLDPILAFLDDTVVVNSDRSVRRALRPLQALAAEHRCSVLMHRHLNKEGGHHALYRGLASIAFVAVCRAAWLAARDPDDPGRVVLAEQKANLAAAQPSLAYTIRATDGAEPTVAWLGPSPWAANQLLAAAAARPAALPARDRARAFLEGALADGPRTSRDLWALAQRQRLSKRTLRRAKSDLEVRSARAWAEGRRLSYWLLPDQKLPDGVRPEDDTSAVDEALARLNAQFPPATPLDDL